MEQHHDESLSVLPWNFQRGTLFPGLTQEIKPILFLGYLKEHINLQYQSLHWNEINYVLIMYLITIYVKCILKDVKLFCEKTQLPLRCSTFYNFYHFHYFYDYHLYFSVPLSSLNISFINGKNKILQAHHHSQCSQHERWLSVLGNCFPWHIPFIEMDQRDESQQINERFMIYYAHHIIQYYDTRRELEEH